MEGNKQMKRAETECSNRLDHTYNKLWRIDVAGTVTGG